MVEAQQRAVRAAERISELQELVIRLNSGGELTPADLAQAESAARQAEEAAQAARLRDRDERLQSAATHRQVADLLRRLGRLDEATRHLEAAEADEHAARGLDG